MSTTVLSPGVAAMAATGEHTRADRYRYRPDLDPNVGVPSWVYMLHLDPSPTSTPRTTPGRPTTRRSGWPSTGPATAPACCRSSARPAGPGTSRAPGQAASTKNAPSSGGGRRRGSADCTPSTERGALADVAHAAERIRAEQARRYAAELEGEPIEPELAAAMTYAASHRVLCAHADHEGRGAHWLEPGEKCMASEAKRETEAG
jgi:hypothetical protein